MCCGGCFGAFGGGAGASQWKAIERITYDEFSAGEPTRLLSRTLKTKEVIQGVFFHVWEAWAGTGITTIESSMGLLTNLELYLSLFEITVIPVGGLLQLNNVMDIQNMGAGTSLYMQIVADGGAGDVADLTAGGLDIYGLFSTLPTAPT